MTPLERYTALCQAAGCTVLGAAVVGRMIAVYVKELPVSADTLAKRLDISGVTLSFGDGTGAVTLWFMAEGSL